MTDFIENYKNKRRLTCPHVSEDYPIEKLLDGSEIKDLVIFLDNYHVNALPTSASGVLWQVCMCWENDDKACEKWARLLLDKGVPLDMRSLWNSSFNSLDRLNCLKLLWLYPLINADIYFPMIADLLNENIENPLVKDRSKEIFEYWMDHGLSLENGLSVARRRWDWMEYWMNRNPKWSLGGDDDGKTAGHLLGLLCSHPIHHHFHIEPHARLDYQKQWINRLLLAGAEINPVICGNSTLYYAAYSNPHLVEYLLEKGADPTVINPSNKINFLHQLMASPNPSAILSLKKSYGLINAKSSDGLLPLHSLGGNWDAYRLAKSPNSSVYLKRNALPYDVKPIIQWCLNQGADVNLMSDGGEPVWLDVVLADPSTLSIWVKAGIDIYGIYEDGLSLLDILSYHPNGWKGMKILLEHGVEAKLSLPVQTDFPQLAENLAWFDQYVLNHSTPLKISSLTMSRL